MSEPSVNKAGKKNMEAIVIILMVAAAIGIGSTYFLGDDNPVEQEMEEVIKDETGLSVDLTPKKEEKKDK